MRVSTAVRGCTFAEGYPDTLHRLAELADDPPTVRLMRDPDNEHDPNAIKVICVAAGGAIGHLPRRFAARLAPLMDRGVEPVAVFDGVRIHPDHLDRPGLDLIVTYDR